MQTNNLLNKYQTKLDLVNELFHYLSNNNDTMINQFTVKLNNNIRNIDNDIKYLTDLKKDYIEIKNNINKSANMNTTIVLEFNYAKISIINDIDHTIDQTSDDLYKYTIQMATVSNKNKKYIDEIYNQLQLPICKNNNNMILIIKYKHDDPICLGEIIGTQH
jgi:rRNA-processing protein FCF1